MSENITDEEAKDILRSFNEQKQNLHSFFTNIIKASSTTKTGNLDAEELGIPKLPQRTLKELELFSKDIYGQNEWADYFKNLAEIQTSTSLSKDAILLKLSVTQKKELADVSPRRRVNRGWFGGKKKDGGESSE